MQKPAEASAPLLLLFDGDCLLCDGVVQWLAAHDPHNRLRFASLQSGLGQCLLQAHGLPADYRASIVAIAEPTVWQESAAVLRILQALGGGWQVPALVGRLIPRFLRDALYRFVARNRYSWFGHRKADEACALPTPALRTRLLS